jgi:hypothetical protein
LAESLAAALMDKCSPKQTVMGSAGNRTPIVGTGPMVRRRIVL